MQIFFQGESLKPLMWRPLFHVPEWSWLGEYTGPAGLCFITSSQNTKHREGQHGDCVRKIGVQSQYDNLFNP